MIYTQHLYTIFNDNEWTLSIKWRNLCYVYIETKVIIANITLLKLAMQFQKLNVYVLYLFKNVFNNLYHKILKI